MTEGTVDFGATDGPMNDEQLAEFQKKHNSGVLHFPTVLGAVVVTYNISGVTESLNLTPEAISGIYLGKITKWNDPALVSANPKVKLPAADIVVVHRSDGSGTSYCWTDYLSKVSDEWKTKVGKGTSVNWPVGIGGKGNEGVSGQVKQTANSIGYVELIYAIQNNLPYARVKNAAGVFIKPDLVNNDCSGGRRSEGHARRLPGIHHQLTRPRRLSHRNLYVAADPGTNSGFGKTQSPHGVSELDAGLRARNDGSSQLCQAAQRSRG